MNGTHLISLVILSSLVFEYSALARICGQGRSEYIGQIVGGTKTTKGDWPWLVALTHGENDDFFCGGSLISAKHVLSGEVVTHKFLRRIMIGNFQLLTVFSAK